MSSVELELVEELNLANSGEKKKKKERKILWPSVSSHLSAKFVFIIR